MLFLKPVRSHAAWRVTGQEGILYGPESIAQQQWQWWAQRPPGISLAALRD